MVFHEKVTEKNPHNVVYVTSCFLFMSQNWKLFGLDSFKQNRFLIWLSEISLGFANKEVCLAVEAVRDIRKENKPTGGKMICFYILWHLFKNCMSRWIMVHPISRSVHPHTGALIMCSITWSDGRHLCMLGDWTAVVSHLWRLDQLLLNKSAFLNETLM